MTLPRTFFAFFSALVVVFLAITVDAPPGAVLIIGGSWCLGIALAVAMDLRAHARRMRRGPIECEGEIVVYFYDDIPQPPCDVEGRE